MGWSVRYDEVESVLSEFSYPIIRDDIAAALAEVTVTFDDDEANLGALVSETESDVFDDVDDVADELVDVVGGRPAE